MALTDPAWTVTDVVLADGGTVHFRPICPEDSLALLAFHARLSDETIRLRFFAPHRQLRPNEVERFTHVDHQGRMAFVATLRDEIIAVARYDRLRPDGDEAEIAFVVEDAHQGRGLATLLLEHLAAFARTRDIRRFVAITLADNTRMRRVFQDAGYEEQSKFEQGTVHFTLDLVPTAATVDAIEARWRQGAVRSIQRLLEPRSIAVIGASHQPGTIGHEIFRNLLSGGFRGPVYPVHPTACAIASVPAYPSLAAIPADIDLAVVVVPADQVPSVIEESARKGVRGLVVISAGFAETGREGAEVQRRLVAAARGAGMRMIGPNCMGAINTNPDVSMNATFAPTAPSRGRVAFSSQSGGLGIAVLEEAERRGLGLSSFVSVGNKADVSGNDLLRYWEQDEGTDVILLYLESFGNPQHFARVARQVSQTKPIVAVKAGRTAAGTRAASSHTAALASPDRAVDALFTHTGVIRVDTLEELFDVAQVLATQPVPAGPRVAIVSNSGGPGILAADACESSGLIVPELSEATQASLRAFLPAAAGVRNPVDLVASGSAADYERAIEVALADEGIDVVLVLFTPPLVTDPDDVAQAIMSAARRATKPIVANFLSMTSAPRALDEGNCRVPSFAFPESAVRAVARVCQYGKWRARPPGTELSLPDTRPADAHAIVQAILGENPHGTWLDPLQVGDLLGAYRIPVADTRLAPTEQEAVDAASRIGYPVVVKAAGPDLVHKSDVGGVRLGVSGADEVRHAFSEMAAALGDRMDGVVIQPMVPQGVETIVGVVRDAAFGPLVMFGAGGTTVELFGDRAFRIAPMTDVDAAELVRSLKSSPLLFGYRGAPEVNVGALEDLLARVNCLAQDVPEIAEMDLNPVIVSPNGVVVVDAKVRVGPAPVSYDPTIRPLG
jgi:acetyl coenzyme A synthetase (ADP forming)-like protein